MYVANVRLNFSNCITLIFAFYSKYHISIFPFIFLKLFPGYQRNWKQFNNSPKWFFAPIILQESPRIHYCCNEGPLDSWFFSGAVSCPLGDGHWQDRSAARAGLKCRTNAAETCPGSWRALLPLTITRDKNTDPRMAGGLVQHGSSFHSSLLLYGPALWFSPPPPPLPCIVICKHLHSHTFTKSPVTSTGTWSCLLISFKLQVTWIAVHGPEEIQSTPEGLVIGSWESQAISKSPVETNVTLNSPVVTIWGCQATPKYHKWQGIGHLELDAT